jgi:hypothetical protein
MPSRKPRARPLRNGRIEFDLESAGYAFSFFAHSTLDRSDDELAEMAGAGSRADLRRWLELGATFAVNLCMDTTARVRVLLREMTEQESAEWVGRVVWHLDLSCGLLGLCGGPLDSIADLEQPPVYVRVPPGRYRAEVYCYLPSSNAYYCLGDWKRGYQRPGAYFRATRPGERFPFWLRSRCADDSSEDPGHEGEWEGLSRKEVARLDARARRYVDFILRLAPLTKTPPMPKLDQGQGYAFEWECRKPSKCPLGIASRGR